MTTKYNKNNAATSYGNAIDIAPAHLGLLLLLFGGCIGSLLYLFRGIGLSRDGGGLGGDSFGFISD